MNLPRTISPAARARRALLFDVLAAAAFTAVVVLVSAGVGVVGFAGLLVATALLLWIGVEGAARVLMRRRRGRGR